MTLVRSILGAVIAGIDSLISEINAGKILGIGRSSRILENAVKDLMSSSEDVDHVTVTIPEILLGLNEPQTQAGCSACHSDNTDHILSDRTLFDLSQFTNLGRIAS